MFRRASSVLVIVAGFLVGLVLASMNHILPPESAEGPYAWAIVVVDWFAPPLAGTLLAGALLYAQRARALHAAEKAAAEVLAERLAGTERRQAIWVVAAAVAHDLKNPLHNVQLLLEELGDVHESGQREELLGRIRENVARATDRLSELSRAGQSFADQTESRVDLSATLDDVRERIRGISGIHRTSVEIICPRGLSVRSDGHALRAAIENVIANGIEALGERGTGGHIIVRAERRNGFADLIVEDNGPGIPGDVQARLFAPFSSGHSGTGLGLAIARALARAGGGDLTCDESRPGKTRFRFTFLAA